MQTHNNDRKKDTFSFNERSIVTNTNTFSREFINYIMLLNVRAHVRFIWAIKI